MGFTAVRNERNVASRNSLNLSLGRKTNALQAEDFDVSLVGFDDEELARLLAAEDPVQGLTDEEDAPALPDVPVSKQGDLWILCSHKLLVGDATVPADVAKLMAGHAADLVFSDPPFQCELHRLHQGQAPIQNDRMTDTTPTRLNHALPELRRP